MRQVIFSTLVFAISAFGAERIARPFFAMDNGLANFKELSEKAEVLKELGYPGVGWRPIRTAEMLKELDARGLKMFATYMGLPVEPEAKVPASFAAEFDLLKGRDTIVWLFLTRSKTKPGDDASAIRLIREVADLAAARNLRVALYAHVGFYVETFEASLRLAKAAERKNVGASFTLCHYLKLDSEANLEKALREAAPHLFLVQINGADSGETRSMSWDRLIQPLGKGSFDVGKVLKVLDEIGYAGPVGLQCFNVKGDQRENLKMSMEVWRTLNAKQ